MRTNVQAEQCTLFNLTGKKFLCPKSKHYIAQWEICIGGVKKQKRKNLLIRFVILFGEVSHYFRYITFIRHICVSHSCVVGKMVRVMGSAAMKRDSEWKTEFGEHMTSELAERHKEPASRIQ